jgi:hypothetical protein
MNIPSGNDIVLDNKDVLTEKQLMPPYKPICFSKAIVGTGNRCSLWYCDGQIPSAHYESFKSYILNQSIDNTSLCLNSPIIYKDKRGT